MANTPAIPNARCSTSVAARLALRSENSIRQLADRGELPCERVGTFRTFMVADVIKLRKAQSKRVSVQRAEDPQPTAPEESADTEDAFDELMRQADAEAAEDNQS
jgi:hypothetical protein